MQINEDSTDMSTSSWENYMYDRKYKTLSISELLRRGIHLQVVIKLGDKVDSGIGLPMVNVLESTYGEVIVIVNTLYL